MPQEQQRSAGEPALKQPKLAAADKQRLTAAPDVPPLKHLEFVGPQTQESSDESAAQHQDRALKPEQPHQQPQQPPTTDVCISEKEVAGPSKGQVPCKAPEQQRADAISAQDPRSKTKELPKEGKPDSTQLSELTDLLRQLYPQPEPSFQQRIDELIQGSSDKTLMIEQAKGAVRFANSAAAARSNGHAWGESLRVPGQQSQAHQQQLQQQLKDKQREVMEQAKSGGIFRAQEALDDLIRLMLPSSGNTVTAENPTQRCNLEAQEGAAEGLLALSHDQDIQVAPGAHLASPLHGHVGPTSQVASSGTQRMTRPAEGNACRKMLDSAADAQAEPPHMVHAASADALPPATALTSSIPALPQAENAALSSAKSSEVMPTETVPAAAALSEPRPTLPQAEVLSQQDLMPAGDAPSTAPPVDPKAAKKDRKERSAKMQRLLADRAAQAQDPAAIAKSVKKIRASQKVKQQALQMERELAGGLSAQPQRAQRDNTVRIHRSDWVPPALPGADPKVLSAGCQPSARSTGSPSLPAEDLKTTSVRTQPPIRETVRITLPPADAKGCTGGTSQPAVDPKWLKMLEQNYGFTFVAPGAAAGSAMHADRAGNVASSSTNGFWKAPARPQRPSLPEWMREDGTSTIHTRLEETKQELAALRGGGQPALKQLDRISGHLQVVDAAIKEYYAPNIDDISQKVSPAASAVR